MTYNKPEVVSLATSIKAIQGTVKRNPHISDTVNGQSKPELTMAAYEADE